MSGRKKDGRRVKEGETKSYKCLIVLRLEHETKGKEGRQKLGRKKGRQSGRIKGGMRMPNRKKIL